MLRDVIFGRRNIRELLQGSEEGIAPTSSAAGLKRLVAAGLLTREEVTRGHRAAYSLTEAGIQALPVMVAMGSWASPYRYAIREQRGCVQTCSATAVLC